MMASAGKKMGKILILIEDGSYLYDNRVKREAETLTEAGYQVMVVCPRYPGESPRVAHKDVYIYRYDKWKWGGGILGNTCHL